MFDRFDKALFAIVGLVVGGAALFRGASFVFNGGYEQGQIDALNNQWLYQRVTTSDGATSYAHLTKATTRPAEAR